MALTLAYSAPVTPEPPADFPAQFAADLIQANPVVAARIALALAADAGVAAILKASGPC